jgi:HAD superfamily hydrolase (TIGR01549 family)
LVFSALKEKKIATAIYSDYPVHEKLEALGIEADAEFCSTDKAILQLKPSGKAIDIICKNMRIPKHEAILIGDREDTDGESARAAKVAFLKVDPMQARKGRFYTNILQMINSNND